MEILETFPRVFCFPKSRINENGGKSHQAANYSVLYHYLFPFDSFQEDGLKESLFS